MQAGLLRKRITFQGRAVTRAANGEELETWADHATVWAEVKMPPNASSGSTERTQGPVDQVQASLYYEVEVRYRTDLDPQMRVVYDGLALNLLAILDPDGRRRRLVLRCQAAVA